jgi:hypothetical protein
MIQWVMFNDCPFRFRGKTRPTASASIAANIMERLRFVDEAMPNEKFA